MEQTISQKIERARTYLSDVPAGHLSQADKHLSDLLEIIDDQWIAYPEPEGEQARLRAQLLAEVPAWLHEYALTQAVATDLSRHPGGTIATVTSWLRAARREAPAATAETLTALAAHIDEQLNDETASRQAIAEDASSPIKDIAHQLPRREPGAAGARTYRVRARRWEHGWELHIDGLGVTQSHGLDDAERMARDYIALELDIPAESFAVVVTPEPDGGGS